MPNIKRRDKKAGDSIERQNEHAQERSSPGSGEDDAPGGADLQPEDVETDDTAR